MSSVHELAGDFETEVIAASESTPILVDFWAAWCGPCRMLGPVLESLADEANGSWRLVKVDTERHPDLAQRFQIRGIPAVKLFNNGEVIAEFAGALPEPQVHAWLQEHLPRASDAALAQAIAQLEGGDTDGAARGLREVVRKDPTHYGARLHLARLLLDTNPAESRRTATAIPETAPEHAQAQHVVLLARLLSWSDGGDADIRNAAETPPEDLSLYRDGARELRQGNPAGALEKWIALLAHSRGLDDDGARRACIALFALLGEENDVTRTWRRRFSSALH